jgi:glutamate-1-semialdehyde 2,1-aminomutase
MGCIPPAPGFLEGLRELCTKHGALLVFDEVMTGFRLSYGGAQQLFNIKPDMTALGKIIGGGLPIAAYGGRKDIMSFVAPSGPIYQAGTLSGNPLAVSAGLAMLNYLKSHPEVYTTIDQRTAELCANPPQGVTVNRVGSMFTMFFTEEPVYDYDTAKKSDTTKFGAFFRHMLDSGIYLAPSQFEAGFMSFAHTEADIQSTRAAIGLFPGLNGG